MLNVHVGTNSEPRRGQMSHICDIGALRVNHYNNIIEKHNNTNS